MKKVLCFVLFLTMVSAYMPVFADQSMPNKISPTFLSEVGLSKNLISLMVELSSDPVTVYSENTFTANHFYQSQTFEYGTNGEDKYRENLILQQNNVLQELRNQRISFSFKSRCTDVMNSFSLDVKGSDISRLSHVPQIKRIFDDRMTFYTTRAPTAVSTGAKKAWSGVGTKGPITGKGVIVGVLDTGLDKEHMTKGEFKGRVLGGFDTADGDADFDDTQIGHGTHVAGIVGGKGKTDMQLGMAYEAKFQIYKVFGNNGGGAGGSAISQAFDRAVRDKCSVINMSLGSEGSKDAFATNSYYGTLIKNANKGGVIVVASAGNSGSRGKSQPFPAGTPGITEDAFCIAATNDRPINTFTVTVGDVTKSIRLVEGSPSPSFTSELNNLSIVSCGYGRVDDFEEDVSGKIALIQRGPKEDKNKNITPITFREKMDNAVANGAKAVLIYNHSLEASFSPTLAKNDDQGNEKFIPTAMMSLEEGKWLLSVLPETYKLSFSSVSQNSVASFSSMGPTPDGFFKPEITAPGTNIVSTYPKGIYAPMSGTSMSSPAVTGLVALLKQAYPKWDTDHVKSALMNTAEILVNPINNIPTSFLLQGAGEARIDRALITPAIIYPRALLIQKEKIEPGKLNPNESVKFTLESNSSSSQTFPLSYTMFGFPDEIGLIKVNFANDQVVVPSQAKVDFSAQFGIDWKQLSKNSYEGIIQVGEDLHIPFVVFRDSVLQLPDAISNISVGPKELIFMKDSTEQDIKIKFSLNSGAEYKAAAVGGADHNNYATIELFVTDEQGELWGTIANLYNYVVGDYEYHWNGKGLDGKYFLPKGKFFVQFRIMGTNYDKDGEKYEYFSTKREDSSKFSITESSVPEPSLMILSSSKVVKMKDIFTVSLILPEVTNCSGLQIELNYDAKKLIGKDLLDGGFLSSDGSSISLDQEIDDDKGVIKATIMRDESTGISGKDAKVITILFQAIYTGTLKFSLKTSKIFFADDSSGRIKVISPSIRVSKYDDFLLSDINDDKTVDQYDWMLFMECYTTKITDALYQEECDFNQDQKIDFEDFIILTKEYGKSV